MALRTSGALTLQKITSKVAVEESSRKRLEALSDRLKLGNPDALHRLAMLQPGAVSDLLSTSDSSKADATTTGQKTTVQTAGGAHFGSIFERRLEDVSFRVFDVEATGLSMIADETIEVAVSEVKAGKVNVLWSSLIRPPIPVPDRIFDLTGIDRDALALAPTAAEVFAELRDALSGDCLVAHNTRHDVAHMQQLAWKYDPHWLLPAHVCTLKLSRLLLAEQSKFGLHALAEALHLPLPSHRAGTDVAATAELLLRLLEKAAAKGAVTLGDLLHLESQRKTNHPAPRISPLHLESAPKGPGVYRFLDEQGHTLYVGYSHDVARRLREHIVRAVSHQSGELIRRAVRVEHQACANGLEAYLLERDWIEQHEPKLNARNAEHGRMRYFRLSNAGGISIVSSDAKAMTDSRLLGPVVLARAERLVLRAVREFFGLDSRPKRGVNHDPAVDRFLAFINDTVEARPPELDVEQWELLTEVRRGLRRIDQERVDARRPFISPTLVSGLPSSDTTYALCVGRPTLVLKGDRGTYASELQAWAAVAPSDGLDDLGEAIVSYAHRHANELQLERFIGSEGAV